MPLAPDGRLLWRADEPQTGPVDVDVLAELDGFFRDDRPGLGRRAQLARLKKCADRSAFPCAPACTVFSQSRSPRPPTALTPFLPANGGFPTTASNPVPNSSSSPYSSSQ